jgi:hypothetical protein
MKLIFMVTIVLIIYACLLVALMTFAKYRFHESVKLVRNIMMTLAGLSFIYSYQKQIKTKEDKIESIIESFPKKWTNILYYIKNNNVSPDLKHWILVGDQKTLYQLSLDDINAIEYVMIEIYELWNKLISLELMDSKSTNYKDIFESKNNKQLSLFSPTNRLIGRLFSQKTILDQLEKGSSFYSKGYVDYIKYCVEFYNRTKHN